MKTVYTLLILTFFFISCGEKKQPTLEQVIATKDLKQIRAKKTELDKQSQEISEKIKLLISEIDELDTLKKIPLVTAIELKEEIFMHYLELQGDVKTKQNVLIFPEMPGTLEKVYVSRGQNVVKGQVLASIDDGGMSQQVAQLEATTALAKTTFERQKSLWDQKIGSEIQFLQTKTNYEAQKNSLAQFKKQLGKSTIRAPFTGVIDEVIKDQGTVVAPGPGSEIFRIVNLNNMFIETAVPEKYISNVTKGKSVEVFLPMLDKTLNTKVKETGNFINPANRTFTIEIEVPNSDKSIKPNLTAKLKINDYTSKNALLISQSIISENAEGQQYVYIISNLKDNKGFAKQTIVKTGKTQGDVIEILEGVTAGDILIEAGARSVKDGQEVKISE
ncbi:MAG: efflux RND transporter periplasmic adaptor subunit [Flavobacteriia bacterium]|nr:efflux RND transporter periplasmic adaptor subunit [Flavobacteriia bacterium]OIP47684.1 MAG: efflux transporter periplasmic adaptor subunit [Flavobacteriaceae bacterium CG2_30_31_66]PIV97374.1 MAG: efflux RND transporter periplasmic adaptor subunit [Flavobacteriaceae bacterium CG17_big_fil_post_rev_8_21_14_2_50_31_13]PIX14229.1 MAG: efflux RND transporter periplasmic adaptor subunit [Flavobacteriaceae bacterium CG_4_8_14_3_um_filter_31_8]PIY14732.1 MAG: efflux RND transporter periplasmic ada